MGSSGSSCEEAAGPEVALSAVWFGMKNASQSVDVPMFGVTDSWLEAVGVASGSSAVCGKVNMSRYIRRRSSDTESTVNVGKDLNASLAVISKSAVMSELTGANFPLRVRARDPLAIVNALSHQSRAL